MHFTTLYFSLAVPEKNCEVHYFLYVGRTSYFWQFLNNQTRRNEKLAFAMNFFQKIFFNRIGSNSRFLHELNLCQKSLALTLFINN